MQFASDNAGPAHPSVMDALLRANDSYALGYGNDTETETAVAAVREVFEAPEAEVFFVTTGTAANSIALSCLAQPWQTVFCSEMAHIHLDECGAPEFFTGGSKLTLVDAPGGCIDPGTLERAMATTGASGVHGVQPGPISLTQATECGTVYGLDHLRALCDVAHSHGQAVHMDGARIANALVQLGCSAADMSWRAGVDAVSFGATKNGCLGAEAVVIFDPDRARDFEFRRKRGGHLLSKHRYLAAQMMAYLQDDLWLRLAAQANEAAANLERALAQVPEFELAHPREANMLFAHAPRWLHRDLIAAGAVYAIWEGDLQGDDPDEPLLARLVCDWNASPENTAQFMALVRNVTSKRAEVRV
ncbi:MAG: beta-eliminating lyase-related protein [Pseudomonadota bacterium]